jgi:hypothetical protein
MIKLIPTFFDAFLSLCYRDIRISQNMIFFRFYFIDFIFLPLLLELLVSLSLDELASLLDLFDC